MVMIEWPGGRTDASLAEGRFNMDKQQVSITVNLISDKTLNV
jgi:hypothetical protein